jgi:hypothetical protein
MQLHESSQAQEQRVPRSVYIQIVCVRDDIYIYIRDVLRSSERTGVLASESTCVTWDGLSCWNILIPWDARGV